jgi:hypothetical protein
MLPALWPGDIVVVRSHHDEEVKPGDIVVFRHGGRLVTHRVVEVRSQESGVRSQEQLPVTHHPSPGVTLVTRGDRMDCNDAPVSSHTLLGRVVAIERGSRRLIPRQSTATRLASWILSKSEFATRVVLKMRDSGLGIRGSGLGTRGHVFQIVLEGKARSMQFLPSPITGKNPRKGKPGRDRCCRRSGSPRLAGAPEAASKTRYMSAKKSSASNRGTD